MSNEKSDLTVDFDKLWAGLTRSVKIRDSLGDVAANIQKEAEALARVVAYDDGYYADLFDSGTLSARRARQLTNTQGGRRSRRRRGQYGNNPYLDVEFTGDGEAKAYDGQLGIVVNTDFKAAWVEYGSIAKGPRRVMLISTENVARKLGGAEVVVLYDNYHQQNIPELRQRLREGKDR